MSADREVGWLNYLLKFDMSRLAGQKDNDYSLIPTDGRRPTAGYRYERQSAQTNEQSTKPARGTSYC